MKKLLLNIAMLMLCALAMAQSEIDALRYSYHLPSGTARYNAMGGSFGALGSDPSVIGFNPAGLGVFKTSQISFSPGFKINNSESSYLDSKNRDYDANYFDFNEISFVNAIERKNDNVGLTYFVWGFSYNKLNNFNENVSINGVNNNGSLTDWFASRANGTNYAMLGVNDPFYSHLAWENYLINPADSITEEQYVSAYDSYGQKQSQRISKSGSLGEYNIAVAFNFAHKVYVGADLGIQSLNYKQKIITSEKRENITYGPKAFAFEDYVYTSGAGVNFKLGILYAPIDKIRVGIGVHTPTSIKLEDSYNTYCEVELGDSTMSYYSPDGSYEYNILSPFRANASICFIPNENLLLNLDYDMANYNAIKMRSDDYDFATETQNIIENYRVGHNVKLGAEYRFGALNLRLGGAFYSSPYKNTSVNSDYYSWLASGGIGFRTNFFFMDIAYSYMTNSYVYYMYEGLVTSEPANVKINRNQITVTLGFKW